MPSRLTAAIVLGQALALLIATTATTSTILANDGISVPTFQSLLNYVLLATVYGIIHFRNHTRTSAFTGMKSWRTRPWSHYVALAFMDVEANFLIVTAYRYTSITSITLLDCFTIPVALFLTRWLLKSMYKTGHYVGAAICIAGLAILVATDDQAGNSSGSLRPLFGDVLVLLAATLYAACNVFQEAMLDDVPVSELLFMLGLIGTVISGIQFIPLELHTVLEANWTVKHIVPFVGFGLALFAFYSLIPYELQWGGAAILNLSLLSADIWTALARVLFFGGFSLVSGMAFLVSFLIVGMGIGIYVVSGEVKNAVSQPGYQPVGPMASVTYDSLSMSDEDKTLVEMASGSPPSGQQLDDI